MRYLMFMYSLRVLSNTDTASVVAGTAFSNVILESVDEISIAIFMVSSIISTVLVVVCRLMLLMAVWEKAFRRGRLPRLFSWGAFRYSDRYLDPYTSPWMANWRSNEWSAKNCWCWLWRQCKDERDGDGPASSFLPIITSAGTRMRPRALLVQLEAK